MGAGGVPMRQLAKELGITKQAAGQLVDTLVLRGYIDRKVDAQDRRKMAIALTERGRGAAGVLEAVREKIDGELLARVGQDNLMRTRRTLAALVELGRQLESESISNASSVEPRGSQGANLTR